MKPLEINGTPQNFSPYETGVNGIVTFFSGGQINVEDEKLCFPVDKGSQKVQYAAMSITKQAAADMSAWVCRAQAVAKAEAKICRQVHARYSLTSEEIKIVEGSAK